MARYLVRRILSLIVALWVVSLVTFVVFLKLPVGNPAERVAGRSATPQTIAAINQVYGFNRPIYIQYARFAKGLVPWPGWFLNPQYFYSRLESAPVKTIILQRLPVTITLALGAAVIWLILGLGTGVISALWPRSVADRVMMTGALAGISAPPFWVGYLFLYVFWYKLRWLPPSGLPPNESLLVSIAKGRFLMPWIALAIGYSAFYARISRATLLDVMNKDYVRTARAKGLKERRVVVRHVLRAGLAPVITMLGLDLGGLMGGTIIIETVFNLPGIGAYSLQAVTGNDLPAIMGITVFAALCIMVANVLVDVTYAYLDPKIRFS